jgi:hypothetical protein
VTASVVVLVVEVRYARFSSTSVIGWEVDLVAVGPSKSTNAIVSVLALVVGVVVALLRLTYATELVLPLGVAVAVVPSTSMNAIGSVAAPVVVVEDVQLPSILRKSERRWATTSVYCSWIENPLLSLWSDWFQAQ